MIYVEMELHIIAKERRQDHDLEPQQTSRPRKDRALKAAGGSHLFWI
jgi:hypothetical protein